jgi:hypothetical protein
MRQVHVTETIFHEGAEDEKRYHTFPLPVALGAGYRQVMSYNAFFHSSTKHSPNWTDRRLFHPAIVGVDPIYDDGHDPTSYAGIYEFFTTIGYDHRRRRYTNREHLQLWRPDRASG